MILSENLLQYRNVSLTMSLTEHYFSRLYVYMCRHPFPINIRPRLIAVCFALCVKFDFCCFCIV